MPDNEACVCCAPSREASITVPASFLGTGPTHPHKSSIDEMVQVPGGRFLMGTEDTEGFSADGEGPIREVSLSPFRIDPYTVSNARFSEFVNSTGYLTDAERFGWSFVFYQFLPDDFPTTQAVAQASWWRQVPGASWRTPEGPNSNLEERKNHPVVHVSWNDAVAYCNWSNSRLPTEAEWERAARGELEQARYPWGNNLILGTEHQCNIWQGIFPTENTAEDGYSGTAPVDTFPPNTLGLHNVAGNVWEWCADWFSASFHSEDDLAQRDDPLGPPSGNVRVIRGGSYLCHASYCNRYRVAARSSSTPDSSTGNMGFRCVADE